MYNKISFLKLPLIKLRKENFHAKNSFSPEKKSDILEDLGKDDLGLALQEVKRQR